MQDRIKENDKVSEKEMIKLLNMIFDKGRHAELYRKKDGTIVVLEIKKNRIYNNTP